MSREKVELVRRMYQAYLNGDAERALEFFHPEVEVDFSVRVDAAVGRGRDELARIVATWIGTWESYSEEIDQILDLGNTVCISAIQRGRGKGSGVELENRFASLYDVGEGRITRIRMYMSLEAALEAAGTSEPS